MRGELNLRLTNRGLFLVLGALGLVWLLAHATNIFVVLFLAVLLAAAVSTTANRLARYHVQRAVAILLTYLVIIAALLGIVALVVPLLTGEARLLRDNLPTYTARLDAALTRLPHPGSAALQVADLTARLGDYAQTAAAGLGRGVLDAGSVLVTTLLVFVIAFFLAVDERFAQTVITRFLPAAHRTRAGALLGRIGDSLGAWVRAQLLVGLFFGAAFAIGLAVLRVPYAFTIGVVGAMLEIIPYIGGLITIMLALLVAATTGQLWLVAAVVI
jgi:predicted PurR-regulated permease PerM